MYLFCLLLTSNLSMTSALSLRFSSSATPAIFYQCTIVFLFAPSSRGPSGTSIHILIFP